ncbi:MAG: hypothetical protein WAW24_11010, partial [Bacteroidales bacterium]
MNYRTGKTELLLLLLIGLTSFAATAQVRTLESFEQASGWSYNISDGVTLNISAEKGVTGNAVRIDYDFTEGTGYGGIQKLFPIDLPDNYEFTFWL